MKIANQTLSNIVSQHWKLSCLKLIKAQRDKQRKIEIRGEEEWEDGKERERKRVRDKPFFWHKKIIIQLIFLCLSSTFNIRSAFSAWLHFAVAQFLSFPQAHSSCPFPGLFPLSGHNYLSLPLSFPRPNPARILSSLTCSFSTPQSVMSLLAACLSLHSGIRGSKHSSNLLVKAVLPDFGAVCNRRQPQLDMGWGSQGCAYPENMRCHAIPFGNPSHPIPSHSIPSRTVSFHFISFCFNKLKCQVDKWRLRVASCESRVSATLAAFLKRHQAPKSVALL